jgi:hypothetical protein
MLELFESLESFKFPRLFSQRKQTGRTGLLALTLILLALACGLSQPIAAQPPALTYGQTTPPAAVPSATYTGQNGGITIYYFVVAHYPIGAVVSIPVPALNTPGAGNLGGGNTVTITWAALTGATNYDVVRNTVPNFPTTCTTCAVATTTSSTSVTDSGGGSSYTASASPTNATAVFSLDNRDDSQPYSLFTLNTTDYFLYPFSGVGTAGHCVVILAHHLLGDSGSSSCNTGGAGTVTFVALTVPTWLQVGGSPVTTAGTLAVTPNTGQTSHQVIGTCGTATTFTPCALVGGDLPLATSSAQGAVPASGGGTTNFLRADFTWAAPPGGGSGCTVSGVQYNVLLNNGAGGCTASANLTSDASNDLIATGYYRGTALLISGTSSVALGNIGTVEYLNPNMRFSLPSSESYYFYNQGRGTNLLMELNGATGAVNVPALTASTLVTTDGSKNLVSATIAADNIYGNFSGSTAVPGLQAIPSCAADGAHAITYPAHTLTCTPITGSGSGYATIDIAGSALTQRPTMNFISGSGITVTGVDNAGATRSDITVSANTAVMLSIAAAQAGAPWYCAPSGASATAYVCSLANTGSATLTAYTTGMQVMWKPDVTCGAACTLNIDSNGAKSIKQLDGATDPGGSAIGGDYYKLVYDGTVFRLIGTILVEHQIIPAANCNNATAGSGFSLPASNSPTAACRAGTNNLGGDLQWANNNTTTNAQFAVQLPFDWDTGTEPFINIIYSSGANTSGTVKWTFSSACAKSDGSISDDPAFNAETATVGKTMAVANRTWSETLQFTAITSGNNCIAGSPIIIKVASGNGTATSAVNVYSVTMSVPRLNNLQAN